MEVEKVDVESSTSDILSFRQMGVNEALCHTVASLGWLHPTQIQSSVIPHALNNKDIIGLAETGSGKTGAFAIPVLHFLLQSPSRLFAAILTPTRELAFQISEVFEALGSSMSLSVVCIVGGIDMVEQSIALAKKPHVVIATPGKLFANFV